MRKEKADGWGWLLSCDEHMQLHRPQSKEFITQDKDTFLLSSYQILLTSELWHLLWQTVTEDLQRYWCNTDFSHSWGSQRLVYLWLCSHSIQELAGIPSFACTAPWCRLWLVLCCISCCCLGVLLSGNSAYAQTNLLILPLDFSS